MNEQMQDQDHPGTGPTDPTHPVGGSPTPETDRRHAHSEEPAEGPDRDPDGGDPEIVPSEGDDDEDDLDGDAM